MLVSVRRLLRVTVIPLAAVLVALTAYARLAPLERPGDRVVLPGTVVLDAHGAVLQRGSRDGFRIPVALGDVAPVMLQATISAEDRRFLSHTGVDPLAITRALMTRDTRPSGASTITQQLARRLYLAQDARPAVVRKVDEMRIATMLEARASKAEILALYLNDVYYGRGAYGVEAAARAYFGTSARNLDLARAAYLAGLPQRPSEYDDAASLRRQRYVLDRMAEDGWITGQQSQAAAAERLALLDDVARPIAPEFVAYALAELARVRPDLAGRDGLVIETTLDAALQSESERLARRRLAEIAERHATDAAVVAIEPRTGRIAAMLGGATDGDPTHGGAINMALAPRQPGSALKPFLYAAAFERGFTAASPLLDVPTTFQTGDALYTPLNYDRAFHGIVPLRIALASSLNVPAVRTLDAIGRDAMLEMLQRVGLSTLDAAETYGLGLSLGGGEVTLLDLVGAYASLADGRHAEPYAIERVRDASGRILYEHAAAAPRRVLSAEHAYVLTDILSDPDARIPGFGGVTPFDLPFEAAVKSGTSTGYRDNWTIGYTPDLALGVWVGNADGTPLHDVSGVEGAGPIWHDAMMAASLSRPMTPFARPAGLVRATVCAPTGLLPGPSCPSPVRELFLAGTVPTAQEHYWSRDANGDLVIDPPLEARAWARDAGLPLASQPTVALRIVSPVAGTRFVPSPELAGDQLLIRIAATGQEPVVVEVDGSVIGETRGDGVLSWALVPGVHTIRAHAPSTGATATSAFEVMRWR